MLPNPSNNYRRRSASVVENDMTLNTEESTKTKCAASPEKARESIDGLPILQNLNNPADMHSALNQSQHSEESETPTVIDETEKKPDTPPPAKQNNDTSSISPNTYYTHFKRARTMSTEDPSPKKPFSLK